MHSKERDPTIPRRAGHRGADGARPALLLLRDRPALRGRPEAQHRRRCDSRRRRRFVLRHHDRPHHRRSSRGVSRLLVVLFVYVIEGRLRDAKEAGSWEIRDHFI